MWSHAIGLIPESVSRLLVRILWSWSQQPVSSTLVMKSENITVQDKYNVCTPTCTPKTSSITVLERSTGTAQTYFKHRSRIRYLSKKKSRILTNFPKLKKFVKVRKKFVKCPSGRGLPTTTEEYDAFHGFMLIKI